MNTQDRDHSLENRLLRLMRSTYRWHLAGFILLNVTLTVLNVRSGPPWWGLWPLVISGGLVTLHYLVYKTSEIDDEWVDARANTIYGRSYDQGHIDSIANSHELETPVQKSQRELRDAAAKRSNDNG